MSKPFIQKSSFCVAPWVHSFSGTKGERKLCCISLPAPDQAQKSTADFHHSNYMNEIRQKMMNGILPEECQCCSPERTSMPFREALNGTYANLFEEIEKSTDESGATKVEPIWVEYRNPICNQACRHCDPIASTQLQEVVNQMGVVGEVLYEDNYKRNSQPSLDLYKNERWPELIKKIQGGKLKRVTFSGGEPLVDPGHYQALEAIGGQYIEVICETSLGVTEEQFEKWLQAIQDKWFVLVLVSIDGIGAEGDYIRPDTPAELAFNRIERLQKVAKPDWKIVIQVTLNSLNLLTLSALARQLLGLNLPVRGSYVLANERVNPMIRVHSMPLKVRDKAIEKWRFFYDFLNSDQKLKLSALNNVVLDLHKLPDESKFAVEHLMRLRFFEKGFHPKVGFMEIIGRSEVGALWKSELEQTLKAAKNQMDLMDLYFKKVL